MPASVSINISDIHGNIILGFTTQTQLFVELDGSPLGTLLFILFFTDILHFMAHIPTLRVLSMHHRKAFISREKCSHTENTTRGRRTSTSTVHGSLHISNSLTFQQPDTARAYTSAANEATNHIHRTRLNYTQHTNHQYTHQSIIH